MEDTIKELLIQIENNTKHFPETQLKELIERKEETIPFLMDILEDVPNNLDKYVEPTCFIHIYAAYLLAQFRVKEAFPIFMNILKLPENAAYELYGDALTDDGARIMASLYDGSLAAIKELIEDEEAHEAVVAQGLFCLVILAVNGILDRESIVDYMAELLNGRLQNRDPDVISWIVDALIDLYPEESYDVIKKVYENEEVDEFIVSLEDVDSTLEETKETVLSATRNNHHRTYIDDTVKELSCWAAFKPDSANDFFREPGRVQTAVNKNKAKQKAKRKAAQKQKRKNRKK